MLRLAVQGAAAAVLAYGAMRALGWPHASWAVISALFVGQRSLDLTWRAVGGRLAGTALGTGVGLIAVLTLAGEDMIPYRLFITGLVLNAVAAWRPSLRYGVVAAAILCLEAGTQPLDGAIDRSGAIGIGSVAGGLCALLLWPERASTRALREARRALASCRVLTVAALRRVGGDARPDVRSAHSAVVRHLEAARRLLEASRRVDRPQARAGAVSRLVHGLERLWHALIVIDRCDRELRAGDRAEAALPGPTAARVGEVVSERLSRIDARLSRSNAVRGPTDAAGGADADALRPAIDDVARSRHALAPVLQFTLRQLDEHLDELARAADAIAAMR